MIKVLRIIGVCSHRVILPKTSDSTKRMTDSPGWKYPLQVGVHHLPEQDGRSITYENDGIWQRTGLVVHLILKKNIMSYRSGHVYVHQGDHYL
jgi:hypothetical protein